MIRCVERQWSEIRGERDPGYSARRIYGENPAV